MRKSKPGDATPVIDTYTRLPRGEFFADMGAPGGSGDRVLITKTTITVFANGRKYEGKMERLSDGRVAVENRGYQEWKWTLKEVEILAWPSKADKQKGLPPTTGVLVKLKK